MLNVYGLMLLSCCSIKSLEKQSRTLRMQGFGQTLWVGHVAGQCLVQGTCKAAAIGPSYVLELKCTLLGMELALAAPVCSLICCSRVPEQPFSAAGALGFMLGRPADGAHAQQQPGTSGEGPPAPAAAQVRLCMLLFFAVI